ncbi:unnamed protein product [Rotaria sordida]|uniref:EF-hand domain-containing protein n=1 Tax=Rotaria sordida TaxID=392033 RepID=A0A814VJS1_9BILA|nr:unnamed protein product [Rotaria sordida]CAF1253228.1 unnamed protein product [Rotaria sordida]CAF1510355.1 unnamed protein product [Rotaria sordida]CAF1658310.1 unnamed protein product [Rotaria sordida]CAF3939757.1 unnamed protein product [Rotaria sordida]
MGNKHAKHVSTELTDKQIASLKAITRYTEKEIREWYEGFIRDCPNGKLDKKKFIEVFKQFYPHGKPEKFCKYAFDTFDTNNDGTVSFEEFLVAYSVARSGNLDARLDLVFDVYDISHDGLIDQEELTKMIIALYDLLGNTNRKGDHDPKKRAAQILTKLDVNQDKKITKEEFINGCKSDPFLRQLLDPNS